MFSKYIMSIANLFVDNSYTIKCANLECRELTAGDVIIPTGIIDDLYTDRIRSGQTQDVVINISSGNADFYGNVYPNVTNAKNLGLTSNRWDNVYCKDVNATGSVIFNNASGENLELNQVVSAAGVQVSGPVIANNITSLGSSSFAATTSCNDLTVSNIGTFNGTLEVNNLLFKTPSGQTALNKYSYISVENGLEVYGAINLASGIKSSYSGTRIGGFVSLSIESFPQEGVFADNQPIIFGILDPVLTPPSGKVISCIVSVQRNIGDLEIGHALIKDNGTVEVYSSLSPNSYFTTSHVIAMGYEQGTYFTLNYNI